MHKKLITACLAVFALAAFALPAVAQATNSPVLTHPTGSILATGSKITATNIGHTEMLSTDTKTVQLTCTTAQMTGTLTKNETGNVQGEITSASFTGTGGGGACIASFGLNATVNPLGFPWCLKSTSAMATDEFQVLGGGCGGAAKKIEFQLLFSSGTCTYQSTTTTAIKGTYTTHPEDAVMHVPRTGAVHGENGFIKTHDSTVFNICPSSSELKMSFTLETDTATKDPLYISS